MDRSPAQTEAILNLVKAIFPELENLREFCFTHYRDVYDILMPYDSLTICATKLVEHVDNRGEIENLLKILKEKSPEKYEQFAPYLPKSAPSASDAAGCIAIGVFVLILALLFGNSSETNSRPTAIVTPTRPVATATPHPPSPPLGLSSRLLQCWPECRNLNLNWEDLRGFDLRNIDLSGAGLIGADLTGTKLEGTILHGARYNRATTWPAGFDPQTAGAINIDLEEVDQ